MNPHPRSWVLWPWEGALACEDPCPEEELLDSNSVDGSKHTSPPPSWTLSSAVWRNCSFLPGSAGHQPLPPEADLLANYVNHWVSAGDWVQALPGHPSSNAQAPSVLRALARPKTALCKYLLWSLRTENLYMCSCFPRFSWLLIHAV